jgi:hypothetical protein
VNTDLESFLREQATTVALDRPVDDVLRRGDRLRRRRTAALAGAGAAAAIAVLAGSIALPPGSSPVVGSAVASWSGGTTDLTTDELAAISNACGERLPIPSGTLPDAAEARNGTVLAYFRLDGTRVTCVGEERPGGRIEMLRGSTQDYTPLPAGTALGGEIRFGASDPGVEGGPVTGLWTVDEVSAQVDHVTAEIGSETFDGTIIDGVTLFWLTGSFSRDQVDDAVFTAYDAQGQVLQQVDPLVVAQEPQGPNDDRGQ